MSLTCCFCEDLAVSGVNTIELDEYYPVCQSDLDRLVSEYSMIAVELIAQPEDYWADCLCGCNEY